MVGCSVDALFVAGVMMSLCVFVHLADLIICGVGFYVCLFAIVSL